MSEKIDFVKVPRDFRVLVLASAGMTDRLIARETKLSIPQIHARLQRFRILTRATKDTPSLRSLYRNGLSGFSKRVIHWGLNVADELQGTQIRSTNSLTTAISRYMHGGYEVKNGNGKPLKHIS